MEEPIEPVVVEIDVMDDSDHSEDSNIQSDDDNMETTKPTVPSYVWPSIVTKNNDGTLSVDMNNWNNDHETRLIFKKTFDQKSVFPLPWEIIHQHTTDEARNKIESMIALKPYMSFPMFTPALFMILNGHRIGDSSKKPHLFDRVIPSIEIVSCYNITIKILYNSHAKKMYKDNISRLYSIMDEYKELCSNIEQKFLSAVNTPRVKSIVVAFTDRDFPQSLDFLDDKQIRLLEEVARHVTLSLQNQLRVMETTILRLADKEWINITSDNKDNVEVLNKFWTRVMMPDPNGPTISKFFTEELETKIDEKNTYLSQLKSGIHKIDISPMLHTNGTLHSSEEPRKLRLINVRDLLVFLTLRIEQ